MHAIIVTGGKQTSCEVGEAIYIEKLDAAAGEKVVFDKVLLVSGDKTVIGKPYVEGAKVTGTVEKQGKAKKIVVFHFNAKKKFRKKQGHRQPYTKVVIDSIEL